ncbi:transcriptional regulator [Oerskovia turbata]|uniref:Transcriptional regulator n=1 Tax=Oerskovia turbata TaxID=1713 RepID=A0A4Q1KZZ6_9CELL|nr:helix-turn-helix domain-containing protein [Oerskovia turbata]RXR28114.1 transcriptional regulator [Oerskovia turbata]RXR35877.1 transcriptional regulator [Oerskovia turbata]TGJ94796.1 transcriptional regulator [Actinotalea fermentans ATCC 43279 = JCM 9966 = DSM 3133]
MGSSDPTEPSHRIVCHLDEVLRARGLTLTELSARTGLTMANLSILKTNKAKAVRFSTLTAVCDALGATPGDLFSVAERS